MVPGFDRQTQENSEAFQKQLMRLGSSLQILGGVSMSKLARAQWPDCLLPWARGIAAARIEEQGTRKLHISKSSKKTTRRALRILWLRIKTYTRL